MKKLSKRWINVIFLLIICIIVTTFVVSYQMVNSEPKATAPNVEGGKLASPTISKDDQGRVVKKFSVYAKETDWLITPEFQVKALAYDATVPGSTIKVTEGDRVQVQLFNQLKEPVSIHWHGYPVPNSMDGVPNYTQDPVAPGKNFTYDFIATVPGTYYYHSHFKSSEQVDRGLYGAFIVLPKQEIIKYDRDYTLILDEWMSMNMDDSNMEMDHSNMNMGQSNSNMDHSNMNMDHSNMNNPSTMDHDQMMKEMYNVYSVNGKSGSLVKPLKVKKGERVRLRFINAGFQTHKVHIPDQEFQVISTDGNEFKNPPAIKDQLIQIGASERYDVSFVAGEKSFVIDLHDDTPGAKSLLIPVQVEGSNEQTYKSHPDQLPVLNMAQLEGEKETSTADIQSSYTFRLNSTMQNEEQIYTINGKSWPNTDPISVKTGEKVKVTFINEGKSDHPMHLHGHTFEVVSYNGKPITNKMLKDTLLVKPGETYEITFIANNPGNWMFHCHDLHHAASGMMTDVSYQDYKGNYQPKRDQAHE